MCELVCRYKRRHMPPAEDRTLKERAELDSELGSHQHGTEMINLDEIYPEIA